MTGAYLIGLTGGVASGKTEVAKRFQALGIEVADADIAAREVVSPGSDGLAELVDAFGRGVLAAMGAWFGLQGILPTILLSSLVGAIIGSIWLAAKGRDRATPIPFGPYLAIAGWLVFFWGDRMVGAYMRFAGLG